MEGTEGPTYFAIVKREPPATLIMMPEMYSGDACTSLASTKKPRKVDAMVLTWPTIEAVSAEL